MVIHDRDIGRFADRSRELWSEQAMSEMKYQENNFLRCCGRCPFASLLAFVITLTGTAIFCGCLFYSVGVSVDTINSAFDIEYIDTEWKHIFDWSILITLAIMGGVSFILLIAGSLATGATRHQIYTGFRSRLGGRITTGFFTFVVYVLLLTWLIIMLIMMIPCIGLYILKDRCDSTWTHPTISGSSDTASPIVCLTPGTYAIPAPRQRPDAKACQTKFNELCTLTDNIGRMLASLIGSVLVVLGLIHFLCCLVANYVHIKDGRKLHDYEEAIQDEIEISKMNQ